MGNIQSVWLEIVDWWRSHEAHAQLRALAPGAGDEALAEAERELGAPLPADLATVLRQCDGGPYIQSYALLSVDGILRAWRMWTTALRDGSLGRRRIVDRPGALPIWWDERWIPFAQDSCGNLVCTSPTGLIHLETQDSQGAYQEPGDFTSWLETYRGRLTSGELVVDAEGFVDES
jgi:cell wall assembly regulator SMI1